MRFNEICKFRTLFFMHNLLYYLKPFRHMKLLNFVITGDFSRVHTAAQIKEC
jgi:hypothetical protein